MPVAPPRPCPRCGRRVLGGGRCRLHQRPSAQARGYTHAWADYARAWLVRFPWCGQRHDGQLHAEHSGCARRGQQVRARVVDHIRSIVDGGALLDPSNHQSLCYGCNNRKR